MSLGCRGSPGWTLGLVGDTCELPVRRTLLSFSFFIVLLSQVLLFVCFIGVKVIYKVVIISAVQQSDPVVCRHTPVLF